MSQPSRRQRWLKIRRRYLAQLKNQVAGYLGTETADLRRYMTEYRRALSGSWRASSSREILKSVAASRLVYGSDFHAFSQSQRTHLRILRALSAERDVVLALEIFESKDQKHVDLFMRDKMDEAAFLDAVHWETKWGFPWSYYRPLILLAKERGWRIAALNRRYSKRTGANLTSRDRHAGRLVAELVAGNPAALVYVIFGDLHVAPSHLPEVVNQVLKEQGHKKPQSLIIFQNSEYLYMRLAKKGRESRVHVLKKGSGAFCVLSSPPWVKWQSYLLFLERQYDSDLGEAKAMDDTDYILGLIRILQDGFSLRFKGADVAAYGPDNPALWVSLEKNLSARQVTAARDLAANGRSFFVPEGGVFFLARPTVNHAAGLAGEYLQSRLSGRRRVLWNMPDDFLARIWVEGLSFFLSKFVNHRRKPDSLGDFSRQCRERGTAGRDALLLTLQHRVHCVNWLAGIEKASPVRIRTRQKSSYLEAARFLGGHLGERMFLAHQSGQIAESGVIDWMKRSVDAAEFQDFYQRVVVSLESIPKWLASRGEQEKIEI